MASTSNAITASEVARCVTAGKLETPYRPLDASLHTMATLDMIRQSIGIDFSAAGLLEKQAEDLSRGQL